MTAIKKPEVRLASSREASDSNGKPAAVSTASKKQFAKAHKKTSVLHAELFRRLAK